MLKEGDIEDFYRHVQSLKLKFPVAALSKATGVSKGNISDYLKRRKSPSENFLKKYYEKFPKDADDRKEDIREEDRHTDKELLRMLMSQMNNLMQTQNNLLQRQQEQVVEKIDRVDTNLIRALQGVSKLVLHVESAREVVLDSLNRIEKKPPGALKKEAGKIMDQLEDLQQKHGIGVGEGM